MYHTGIPVSVPDIMTGEGSRGWVWHQERGDKSHFLFGKMGLQIGLNTGMLYRMVKMYLYTGPGEIPTEVVRMLLHSSDYKGPDAIG